MSIKQKHRGILFLLLAAMLLAPPAARASGTWTRLPEEETGNYLVREEYTGTVKITFLGDCTLGGEEKTRNSYRGFFRTIERNGYGWPFRNLEKLTAADDLTVANLEGVLSDRNLEKVNKTFNFIGPTAYTEILKSGSVECVTLANNHSHDYDLAGYNDTKSALETAGLAFFTAEDPVIWQNDEGLMIGFIGVSMSLSGNKAREYARQADALRSAGCAAVITVMHGGTEYDYVPDGYQRQIVSRALSGGTDLIIGHHPHVVQGFEIREKVPVVYSLGNCVFGGNLNPRDHDALAVQAELSFREGALDRIALHFYPVSVSGEANHNDYSPVLLSGADAERVLEKMKNSTGNDPGPFDEAEGAVVRPE